MVAPTTVPSGLVSIHGRRLMLAEDGLGKMFLDGFSKSFPSPSNMVAGGSTQTVNGAYNGDRITNLDTLAGTTITLPAATGSGHEFTFVVTVVPTSNAHIIQVASATDFFVGQVQTVVTSTPTTWQAANSGTVATNSDTITLNGTTTGGLKVGDLIKIKDTATATWQILYARTSSSGSAATPFSAAV